MNSTTVVTALTYLVQLEIVEGVVATLSLSLLLLSSSDNLLLSSSLYRDSFLGVFILLRVEDTLPRVEDTLLRVDVTLLREDFVP